MRYSVASFFTGIGGIDLAFTWAGFDITTQCEIDPYCQRVLKKHAPTYWKDAKLFGDIHEVTSTEMGHVDVIVGGFPCQDISIAGKQRGITKGTRSGLWFELLRLISDVRPRAVLLENVSNILRVGGTTVIATLAEIGYDCQWTVLRAADVGAPHPRNRWFAVAYPRQLGCDNRRDIRGTGYLQTDEDDELEKVHAKRGQRIPRLGTNGTNQSQRCAQERGSGKDCFSDTRREEAQSRLGGESHGLPSGVDRLKHQWPATRGDDPHSWEEPRIVMHYPERRERIQALGNAVVPQQVYPFALTIRQFLEAQDGDTAI